MSACAAVRACSGVTVWRLRDPDTWLDSDWLTRSAAPNAPLLLDAAGQAKPAYFALRDALLGRCATSPRSWPFCSLPWPPQSRLAPRG